MVYNDHRQPYNALGRRKNSALIHGSLGVHPSSPAYDPRKAKTSGETFGQGQEIKEKEKTRKVRFCESSEEEISLVCSVRDDFWTISRSYERFRPNVETFCAHL